jgi:hypothetical protein
MASAGLLLSVDGVVDPPDSEVIIKPSEWVTIDIWSDGLTPGTAVFLTMEADVQGAAEWTFADAVRLQEEDDDPPGPFPASDPGDPTVFVDVAPGMRLIDLAAPIINFKIPEGTVVDVIRLHCLMEYVDILLTLSDATTGEIYDTQVIHQIPEPMTIGLLGLGGLFLRRRK